MILQNINPLIDKHFSEHSYGFQPGKNCQQAIAQAGKYYEEGYTVVVDCDLKSYFDTTNHQKLMHRMKWYIDDKNVLQLLWNFLNAGVMDGMILTEHDKGTPQGGSYLFVISTPSWWYFRIKNSVSPSSIILWTRLINLS